MKRSYEDSASPYNYYHGDLPTPEYTNNTQNDHVLTKNSYTNFKKPTFAKSKQFNNDIIDSEEIIQVYQPTSTSLQYLKFNNILQEGKYLVLLFFGVGYSYLSLISQYYQNGNDNSNNNIQIVGVSNYIQENEFSFPIITNNLRLVKNCNVLDPLGGGVYPRDCILIFDSKGQIYKIVELGFMNNCPWGVNNGRMKNVIDVAMKNVMDAVSIMEMEEIYWRKSMIKFVELIWEEYIQLRNMRYWLNSRLG